MLLKNTETSVLLRIMRQEGLKFKEVLRPRQKVPVFYSDCPFCKAKKALLVNVNHDTWGCTKCHLGMELKPYAVGDGYEEVRPHEIGDIFDFMQIFKNIQSLEQTVYYLQEHYKIFGDSEHSLNHGYYSNRHKMNNYDQDYIEPYQVHYLGRMRY